ncbi:DUF1266 domain-containing protein [Streptomyces sp. NPDC002851]
MSAVEMAGVLLKAAFGPSAAKRYPHPLTAHQRWMVALPAILTERYVGGSHTTLYPLKRIDAAILRGRLEESWDVTSSQTLHSTLDWLATEGHRTGMVRVLGHPPVAWDFVRYADVVRAGFGAGYVDEGQAWHLLGQAIAPVTQAYASWRDFAADYLAGRRIWMQNVDPDFGSGLQEHTEQSSTRLLDPANRTSPWCQVPWQAIRYPDHWLTPGD